VKDISEDLIETVDEAGCGGNETVKSSHPLGLSDDCVKLFLSGRP